MTPKVGLVGQNTTIRDAAVPMRDDTVGALPAGENEGLVGPSTDSDIVD